VPANVARPLIEGLRHDLIADDEPIRRLIPLRLRSYDQAIREALEAERTQAVPARWTEGALAYRGSRADVAFYSKRMSSSASSDAPVAATSAAIASIGGDAGWPAYDWLWRLRAVIDRLVGGPGMRRGRRHPSEVQQGDIIECWRVVAVKAGRRLTLMAEMRLPGSAVLELETTPA